MNCRNPNCRDWLPAANKNDLFCPACRYMGRIGAILGGFVVGAIIALIKLFS